MQAPTHPMLQRTGAALLALVLAGCCLCTGLITAPAARADEWRDKQYWLAESGITKAWEVSKGAGVKVAVIDSGVDAGHPDLKGAIVGGYDASGSGQPDGQKSVGAKPEHGTLVATMLAGRGHQPAGATPTPTPGPAAQAPDGIMGVAPEAQILAVSTWLGSPNPSGKSDQDQIPEAVRWAVDNGAKVINISLGSTTPEWPQSWDAAFLYAEQKDVVIVAAAGNRIGGNTQVGAPATIPGVLTVAGLDRTGTASVDASSQGISIGVAAPAQNLLGGLPGGGYAEWAGTSGSTPIVAGVAALIRSKWPAMTAEQVINRIVSTAKDAGPPGKDPLYGYGILNAEAALKADVPEAKANPLGTIAEWIRVHRRGNPATPTPVPSADVPSAAPMLPNPTVPAAEAPSRRDTAIGAAVVIGFALLFVAIIAAAAVQLRRAARDPVLAASDDAETGAFEKVDSGRKPQHYPASE
ncbi:S8 family serine peptidase [Arthrobacter sp. MPF02]|uniref:S8 family serine peptidase n=1 Tax=Arthrobacter sp. MPF02 TaxID=3388492 RepID=UPI003984F578